MSNKKSIYKPKPVSGFPEWLPEERLIEQQWFDHIRSVFESYGFCSIETPSVEELDVLNAKSEEDGADVDKEVYVIERLHKEEGDKDARLALHFDQTVPFARYTAQHFNELVFPFKRYQIQRVWRGERPQAGRFREFYQCDIDVINVDALPLHFDAEMPAIIWETLSSLPGMENEKIQIRISNRKILMGLLAALKIENTTAVTRLIDKIEKLGEEKLSGLLKDENLNDDQIAHILSLSKLKTRNPAEIMEFTHSCGLENDTMKEGAEELAFVMGQLAHLPADSVVADLGIVRGLDYYTGTVYETVFVDNPEYGSICSGGRYDDLASSYINKKLPGVGISIGFSRLFDRLRTQGKLPTGRKSAADVLMFLPSEEQRDLASKTARALRENGINVELYHAPQKFKKQISYAEKKGIPYIWFIPAEDSTAHKVRNMSTREEIEADPASWSA